MLQLRIKLSSKNLFTLRRVRSSKSTLLSYPHERQSWNRKFHENWIRVIHSEFVKRKGADGKKKSGGRGGGRQLSTRQVTCRRSRGSDCCHGPRHRNRVIIHGRPVSLPRLLHPPPTHPPLPQSPLNNRNNNNNNYDNDNNNDNDNRITKRPI